MVWYSHLFQNIPVYVIHTVKGFGIVNKAEIDVFLEISCFFHDPVDVGNLISGSSAFDSKEQINVEVVQEARLKLSLSFSTLYIFKSRALILTLILTVHHFPIILQFFNSFDSEGRFIHLTKAVYQFRSRNF